MKRILTFGILFAALLLPHISSARKTGEVVLCGLGPLQTESGFIGYYKLLQVDKPAKDKEKYNLIILDPVLNKVAEKELIEDENFTFVSSAFDGNNIILKYIGPPGEDKEAGERQLTRIYDTKLNQVKTRTIAIGKTMGKFDLTHGQASPFGVYPATGGGFMNFNIINTQRTNGMRSGSVEREGYMVEYVPTAPTASGWRYKSGEGRFELNHYIGQTPRSVYVFSMEKEKIFDYSLDYYINGFDRTTGRRMRFHDTIAKEYSLLPSKVCYLDATGQDLFAGVYFDKAGNAFSKSLGIFSFTMDSLGKVVHRSFITWEDLAAQAKAVNTEDFGKLYIQNAIRTTDGRIYLIGERFGTGMSASLGNAVSRISTLGTTGTKKLSIGDLVILEFTSDLQLRQVHNYSKPGHGLELLSAIGAPSSEFQLYTTNATLDYRFAQESADKSNFIIYYDIYHDKNSYDLGAVVFNNGKFTTDKIALSAASDARMVLPNSFGSVGIFDYYKDEKRFAEKVEKVNY
jgi:hypothetical protein